MPDGVHLAATIHRPDAPGAFPALLESIPYRKDDWLIPGHLPIHAEFAAHGYVSVLLDIRGTGSSEGVAEDEYTESEITDNLTVLAWLREQPWCDGRLGMFGISWGGFAALQAAMRRPPGLEAIVPVGATHDRYALDVHYIGGTLHVNESVTWPVEMVAENALPPDPERFGPGWHDAWLRRLEATPQWAPNWLRHQRRDDVLAPRIALRGLRLDRDAGAGHQWLQRWLPRLRARAARASAGAAPRASSDRGGTAGPTPAGRSRRSTASG